ncbi:hypothetical protein ACOSQ4_002466 [Xanthoceras sorbifolium]
MDLFEVLVHFGSNVVELDHCHSDHISRFTLLHVLLENQTGNSDPLKEEYIVCVNFLSVMIVFEIFRAHIVRRIMFQVGVI